MVSTGHKISYLERLIFQFVDLTVFQEVGIVFLNTTFFKGDLMTEPQFFKP